ncbi:hypothetical protein [Jiangella asiatica]|uniref:Uncharacterized protein n=1 Tax=Jiangella asiatica TaxID=2530372 RepID=A0A4V2YZK1_9ACTN|nr:hypothetical protein [Jiangella asiatica]TDD97557.1 hypothetical protein E1269_29665 [Jiangella asiatica]
MRRRGRGGVAVLVAVAGVLAGCSVADDGATDDGTSDGGLIAGSGEPTDPATRPAPSPSVPACDAPCYGSPETTGDLSEDTVVEVSGMAASQRTPGLYYVVSDEAGTSEVVAVREDGTPVARIELAGMSAENAEALAVGSCGDDGDTCVYVGDIGDHVGRDEVVVYRAPEPDLDGVDGGTVEIDADELRYTYPDEPTDAEALMVDDAGRPLIVSKATFDRDTEETGPTRLYRGAADGGELELIGEIELPAPERGLLAGLVGNVVTDAAAAGGLVLLRTYDEVLEYRAGDEGDDLASFPQWPMRRVPAPGQLQSETVTYVVDGCGYLTTSELTGAVDVVRCE